ncbi:MAG: hypothetical protein SOR95_08260 [Sutterella sp.]|nr:hypothetical protein [Sutterella sp.]
MTMASQEVVSFLMEVSSTYANEEVEWEVKIPMVTSLGHKGIQYTLRVTQNHVNGQSQIDQLIDKAQEIVGRPLTLHERVLAAGALKEHRMLDTDLQAFTRALDARDVSILKQWADEMVSSHVDTMVQAIQAKEKEKTKA